MRVAIAALSLLVAAPALADERPLTRQETVHGADGLDHRMCEYGPQTVLVLPVYEMCPATYGTPDPKPDTSGWTYAKPRHPKPK